ncbi:MAG: dihydropteroate synthase [Bryobacterales bacterium]|nr:dihydropteroate synthase [Bryobacterales bacterium]
MAFQRTRALWSLPHEHVTLGVSTFLTVRINLTKGRQRTKPDPGAILNRALELEASAANIVELQALPLSAASGIPSAEDELPLLVPIVRKLSGQLKVPISVVTVHSQTAYRVANLGASIVHDLSGLAYDRLMAPTVNGTNSALILGHMRGAPEQWPRLDPLTNLEEIVRHDFSASLLRADKSNIARQRIVLDPGLEHGKQGHENFNLLRRLSKLIPPAQGIQVTLAGKRFLTESIQASAEVRAAGLAVAATLAVESGAHMLTVEDNLPIRYVVDVMDRIYRDDMLNLPDVE